MAHPERNIPERMEASGVTVLDRYLAQAALGHEHRYLVAMREWDDLTPEARLELQTSSRAIAGNNPVLGAEYAQSVLLLKHVNDEATRLLAA